MRAHSMDPYPIFAAHQQVWLWTPLEGSSGPHWTQGVVTFVHNVAQTDPRLAGSSAARNLSYSVAYYDRYNRRTSTTVGPSMIRPRRHLLPSEDGL